MHADDTQHFTVPVSSFFFFFFSVRYENVKSLLFLSYCTFYFGNVCYADTVDSG